jgi:hypothetical protein
MYRMLKGILSAVGMCLSKRIETINPCIDAVPKAYTPDRNARGLTLIMLGVCDYARLAERVLPARITWVQAPVSGRKLR